MRRHIYYVYFLTNKHNTVLYIGVTNNLKRRVWEHKNKIFKGFTYDYNVEKLVYYEVFTYIRDAIRREKQLKGWRRAKKDAMINKENPGWRELYGDI